MEKLTCFLFYIVLSYSEHYLINYEVHDESEDKDDHLHDTYHLDCNTILNIRVCRNSGGEQQEGR